MTARALLFLAGGLLVALHAQAEEVLLSDFTAVPPAVYGTWLDAETGETRLRIGTSGGLEVFTPSTGKGGACEKDLKLSFAAGAVLKLTAVVQPDNRANKINILLEDSDGVQAGWSLSLSDLQPGEKGVLVSAPLGSPNFVTAKGSDSEVDLTRIVSWHVQGDFSSDDPIHLVFERLVVLPEGP